LAVPLVFIVAFIVFESKGGVFYKQVRVGRFGKTFKLIKFRTMRENSDKGLKITVGNNDSRITKSGKFLRRYKIDELPQLYNILKGEMSFVGPRPEVPKYVAMYDERQLKVLSIRPGITDYASIKFRNENELLSKAEDPEKYYITEVMPHKLGLNLYYLKTQSFILDIKLILRTLIYIFVKN